MVEKKKYITGGIGATHEMKLLYGLYQKLIIA
ncbi:hypothetical protein Q2T41_03065 [Maribacter confluentis]|uniref:Uncharacterized protein n=1 Tax=Maribacter confluentis TaxID=1656093 RepID=A0ABT8RL33_9FLAO|nr:hypothetical protein [Maribacter confluentis]MDO1511646.1 hypothetical protein [Maribacter confluentis]